MKFLVDNQLPQALAEHLRKRGHDCQHVLDVGLSDASDVAIYRYAQAQERILSPRMKISSISPISPNPR